MAFVKKKSHQSDGPDEVGHRFGRPVHALSLLADQLLRLLRAALLEWVAAFVEHRKFVFYKNQLLKYFLQKNQILIKLTEFSKIKNYKYPSRKNRPKSSEKYISGKMIGIFIEYPILPAT